MPDLQVARAERVARDIHAFELRDPADVQIAADELDHKIPDQGDGSDAWHPTGTVVAAAETVTGPLE